MGRYQRDGFVVLRNFFTPMQIDFLRQESLRICRNEVEGTFFGQDFKSPTSDEEALSRYLCIHFPHKLSSELRDFIAYNDRTNAVLRQLVGSPNVKTCQSMLFFKKPGDPGQGWHQDESYIPTRDRSLVGNWIPLDNTDVENGCLWVWPGSHRRGVIYPHRPLTAAERFHPDGHPLHEGEMADGHGFDERDAVPVKMSAGDILFFHGYLLHRSLENRKDSGRFRRALTSHFLSCESLLPWRGPVDGLIGRLDFRDVIINCGTDPYAYKGVQEQNRPYVRPRTQQDGSAATAVFLASGEERAQVTKTWVTERRAYLAQRAAGVLDKTSAKL